MCTDFLYTVHLYALHTVYMQYTYSLCTKLTYSTPQKRCDLWAIRGILVFDPQFDFTVLFFSNPLNNLIFGGKT